MDVSARTVVASTRLFDEGAAAFLRENGCQVIWTERDEGHSDDTLDPARLMDLLRGANGWIVGPNLHVTHTLLAECENLLAIARRGVGYEKVDVAAARDLGRVVLIAPGANDPSVADFAVGLMLGVGKRLHESHQLMAAGDWKIRPGTDLYRKTVGLVGLGRIARQVAQRLRGFEATILAYDPYPDTAFAEANGIQLVDMERLLAESDYVSIHVPLTPETRNLIDAAALASMKKTAILVNTARGGLVDEVALLDALRNGKIAGAGMDVFLAEGDPAHKPTADALLALPNMLATPHAAGSSNEALQRGNLIAAQGVLAVLNGTAPAPNAVVVDGRTTR
jgi:D-3-phosphoglycerate dehydrogenase